MSRARASRDVKRHADTSELILFARVNGIGLWSFLTEQFLRYVIDGLSVCTACYSKGGPALINGAIRMQSE